MSSPSNLKVKNARCDCGKPATRQKGGYMICQHCFDCEAKGCCGGPTTAIEMRSEQGKKKLAKRQQYAQSRKEKIEA